MSNGTTIHQSWKPRAVNALLIPPIDCPAPGLVSKTMKKIELFNKALQVGTLCLQFKRTKYGWAAFVPSKQNQDGSIENLSNVKLCDFSHMTLRRLRFAVASRYLAQVYEDSMTCHINLRWAMKLPNWTHPYGALNELAAAMHRAGLI